MNTWQPHVSERKFSSMIQDLPKCEARKRGTDQLCQAPAMRNGRCRLHGGQTPSGIASPHFKHGKYARSRVWFTYLNPDEESRPCIVMTKAGRKCRQRAMKKKGERR